MKTIEENQQFHRQNLRQFDEIKVNKNMDFEKLKMSSSNMLQNVTSQIDKLNFINNQINTDSKKKELFESTNRELSNNALKVISQFQNVIQA